MTINPWEVQPLTDFDEAIETTYASIGRALSTWESLEHQLAQFFSFFATDGQDIDSFPAVRAYGSIITFRGRSDMLKASAEAYFARHRDPPISKRFDALLKAANNYAARRNEIAHGIVRPGWRENGDLPPVYALMPTDYATNKNTILPRKPYQGLETAPRYVYSSREIDGYASRFREIEMEAIRLMGDWYDRHDSAPLPRL